MARKIRKGTNELEFQGQVVGWLNEEIGNARGSSLDRATQEKPRKTSGKRSDLVVWRDRAAEAAFLAIELKTPTTQIGDPVFFADAIEKAQHWKAPYFAVWNMREAELYETPPVGGIVTPADALRRWPALSEVHDLEDWLRPVSAKALRARAVAILDVALRNVATGGAAHHVIDAEIFVARLTDWIGKLRTIVYKELAVRAGASGKLRRTLNKIAAEQGFKDFVEDIQYAIAGQIGYRLIGQVLFYFALRRKQPALKAIELHPSDKLPDALLPYWNDVRRFDYEALFRPEPIDSLVTIPPHGQALLRNLIEHFASYDWASLSDDVLGSIFEHLIPREEQILLGQFYTPRPVADFLVALTVEGSRPLVVDPGCGSGTFLMSAYDYLTDRTHLSHKDLLSIIWGFDLSPFASELAAINLFRKDLSEFDNFPRIVPGNFFDRKLGDTVEFPQPRAKVGATTKIPVPIPAFDCILGNPPYLRSQNQDDLDPAYRDQLFNSAARVGIKAHAKTDLFAFFIYHAYGFMSEGARLGFVTPASWLTADYAAPLQAFLLRQLRLDAIVSSSCQSFFPQVDINAVLLVAENCVAAERNNREVLRFVNLKRPIEALTTGMGTRRERLTGLADSILEVTESFEDDHVRVKCVPLRDELSALAADPQTTRNWSKFLRAPLSYYELFGDVS